MNTLYLLECADKGTDPTSYIDSSKVRAWKQTLIRKGYLLEEGRPTVAGLFVIKALKETDGETLEIRIDFIQNKNNSNFEKWWAAYPSTDEFEHKGKKFKGNRGLRTNKAECKLKLLKVLEEGDYTIEDLIKALEVEVHMKKESSISEGENKLKYMRNSLTYLNQRTFENFIELGRAFNPSSNSTSLDIDI